MFEHDQSIVTSLIAEDKGFKRLYEKHSELKRRVDAANAGTISIDQYDLENIKKEKLLLKDKMASMIENHRTAHSG